MEDRVPSREQLIQELHEQRERVRHLLDRLNQGCEPAQSRRELIQELHEQRKGVGQLFGRLSRDYENVEEKLRSREEQLGAIVQASPLAMISMDLDGAVTLWNPAAERIFGWSEEEVMGKPLPYVTEETRQEHMKLRNRVFSGEAFSSVEVRRMRKDGSPIHISVSTAPLRDSTGAICGIMSLNEDITDRKLAETALEESERNYREIFNGTKDAILIHDPDTGAILDVNRGMLDMYGYSREKALQVGVADLSLGSTPFDRSHALERVRKALAEGPQTFEWIARKENGDTFWAEVVLKGTTVGGSSRVLAVVRDIDERKRAQEELHRKEEYYRSLFENAMDIVTILAPDGTILYESPSVKRIVGFEPGELVGLNGFTLIHPEDVGPIREIFERLVRNPGSIERGEFRFRHKDGSWRALEAVGNNLLHDPAVGAIVLNERDVTDRRRMEQQMRVSLQEKETLLKEIHHRVKNNLQVISSLLDLQSGAVRNPEVVEVFREGKQRVMTMAMIHERLYGTGDFSSVVLSEYIEDLVHAIVQANRPDGSVEIHMDIPAIPLSVDAAVPCGLIINELISNCLKHAFTKGHSGYISIVIQSLGDNRLTLLVEDDGLGLPDHVDVDKTRTLGLTIVRVLVKQLNGTMEVQRGVGTRIRIIFSDSR